MVGAVKALEEAPGVAPRGGLVLAAIAAEAIGAADIVQVGAGRGEG